MSIPPASSLVGGFDSFIIIGLLSNALFFVHERHNIVLLTHLVPPSTSHSLCVGLFTITMFY